MGLTAYTQHTWDQAQTTPYNLPYSTDSDFNNTIIQGRKNQKLQGGFDVLIRDTKDTTPRAIQYGMQIKDFEGRWNYSNLKHLYASLILIYQKVNEVSEQNELNKIFLKKSEAAYSLKTLHDLISIGTEIFKDARPSTKEETEAINSFIRKRAKVISTKKI